MKRKKIAFLSREHGNWIDQDFEFLQTEFEVRRQFVRFGFLNIIQICLNILKADLVYFWFGSIVNWPFVMFAWVFRKKIVIVGAGFDVARLDEISHGAFTKSKLSQWFRRSLFMKADLILCVSESNVSEVKKNIPKFPHEKIRLLHLGFEPFPAAKDLNDWEKRDIDVVTIASAKSFQVLVKGLDQFAKLVRQCPQIKFCHIGGVDEQLPLFAELKSLPNLQMLGYVKFGSDQFCQTLNRSRIVVQLSRYESFCSSVVEAASMGAYPVVFKRFALPELVTGVGQSVEFGNIAELSQVIESYLHQPTHSPSQISEHFLGKYPISKRQKHLIAALVEVMNKSPINLG